jgi:tRNA G10  N-methylase Trm11
MAVRTAFETNPAHSPIHNKLALDDQTVHRWYRFVLSFPPHLVREYLERFELGPGSHVLDPFCGTGTTVVECKKNQVSSFGIEATPMGALASRVKTSWDVDECELFRSAEEIAAAAERMWKREEPSIDLGLAHQIRERRGLFGLRELNEEQSKMLLAASISPLPLHKALLLREQIGSAPAQFRDHLRVALAWSLVNEVGNVKFGPEVGITKPRADADVFGSWLAQVERMVSDLKGCRVLPPTQATILYGDARAIPHGLPLASIDAVITSPPYPNEKDYTRTTRLESVILELYKTKKELRDIKRGLVRSNTRSVYVDDIDDKCVEEFAEIQRIAEAIEHRRLELGKTSGFERLYHRVTRLYFGGMKRHLESLKPYLRPGARLAYVVGDQASYLQVMVRTGNLLAEIAQASGYQVESIDLFRTRLATATKAQLREEVVVLQWPGA